MKKIISLILSLTMAFVFIGCNTEESSSAADETGAVQREEAEVQDPESSEAEDPETDPAASAEAQNAQVLVAYFSWAENAVLDEDVDSVSSPSVISPGNVQQLAGWVQEETGGDLFSIQVTDPYPSDWDECLSRANQERSEDARPELVQNVENIDQYDTVFLGYPNWWYGVPMALLSFLEQNDLSGKDVYLFCSHGTGGLANSVEIIREAAPDAIISDNIFDCYEEDAASSQDRIREWAAGLGYTAVDTSEEQEETAGMESEARQISVVLGENTVIYKLNDSPAASSLYEQLPLTIEVEDFSTNEKIFYPLQGLDTTDTPLASNGAGTLAYYAPWGDVVMFYDDYSENTSLYELGQAVSGGELVSQMSGTVTIDTAD